jgi:hypothetical protein
MRGKMMVTRILLLMVGWVLCVGCSPTFPKMPHVKSPQARDCLRTCQHDHNLCADACTDGDNVATYGSREACIDYCVEALEACYARCVQIDSQDLELRD